MRLHHRLWRRLLVLRRLLGWWLELLLLRLLVLLRRLLGWRLVLLRWLLVLLRRLLVLLRRLLGWRLVLLHWLRRRWRLVLLPGGRRRLVLRLLRRSVRLLLRRRRSFPVIRSQRVLLSRTLVLSDATLNVFQFRNSSVSFYGCLRVVEREHGDELTLRIELVLSRHVRHSLRFRGGVFCLSNRLICSLGLRHLLKSALCR